MNILKRELRANLKTFIFWSIGLFMLIFAGITKYTGIMNAGTDMDITAVFDKFPKVLLAILGMVGVDVQSIGGYYSLISYYSMICIAIYAVSLGNNAVSAESMDKTYEFIFTKPRTRTFILIQKLLAAFIYLVAFSILSYLFSVGAIASLQLDNNINDKVALFSLTVFLIGLVFLGISSFLAAWTRKGEKGSLYGNLTFVVAFIIGITYDVLEDGGLLKLFAPLKYFSPIDILDDRLDLFFVLLSFLLFLITTIGAFYTFNKKDLNG